MTMNFAGWKTVKRACAMPAAAGFALAMATAGWAQSTPQSDPAPASNPPSSTQSTAPGDNPSAQPTPGTTPVAGDTQPTPPQDTKDKKKDKKNKKDSQNDPAAGTEPVKGDVAAAAVDPEKVVAPGSEMIKVKPGSIDDVSAVGNRDIGGRGLGNWYSTDTEIKMGKTYADEIEKSSKFITDPTITEYVNRVGQNIVKNSDCKVPFTIKVLDSDQINAFALPGGFFYVNSGLILAADSEAELAGVMGHEISHVAARHGTRNATKGEIAQLAMIPVMMLGPGGLAGLGIYEGLNVAIPLGFL